MSEYEWQPEPIGPPREKPKPEELDYWTTRKGILDRLELMAHTFTWSTFNEASHLIFKKLGARELKWVTMGDVLVCPLCDHHDGETFRVGTPLPWLPQHPRCRCYWDVVS